VQDSPGGRPAGSRQLRPASLRPLLRSVAGLGQGRSEGGHPGQIYVHPGKIHQAEAGRMLSPGAVQRPDRAVPGRAAERRAGAENGEGHPGSAARRAEPYGQAVSSCVPPAGDGLSQGGQKGNAGVEPGGAAAAGRVSADRHGCLQIRGAAVAVYRNAHRRAVRPPLGKHFPGRQNHPHRLHHAAPAKFRRRTGNQGHHRNPQKQYLPAGHPPDRAGGRALRPDVARKPDRLCADRNRKIHGAPDAAVPAEKIHRRLRPGGRPFPHPPPYLCHPLRGGGL